MIQNITLTDILSKRVYVFDSLEELEHFVLSNYSEEYYRFLAVKSIRSWGD